MKTNLRLRELNGKIKNFCYLDISITWIYFVKVLNCHGNQKMFCYKESSVTFLLGDLSLCHKFFYDNLTNRILQKLHAEKIYE